MPSSGESLGECLCAHHGITDRFGCPRPRCPPLPGGGPSPRMLLVFSIIGARFHESSGLLLPLMASNRQGEARSQRRETIEVAATNGSAHSTIPTSAARMQTRGEPPTQRGMSMRSTTTGVAPAATNTPTQRWLADERTR